MRFVAGGQDELDLFVVTVDDDEDDDVAVPADNPAVVTVNGGNDSTNPV
ncbi:MAG TPA: hypothetical protein VFL10_02310 [Ornithinibacter sp.]|nr:hypothetical protein [Ornithinibacter sp.]